MTERLVLVAILHLGSAGSREWLGDVVTEGQRETEQLFQHTGPGKIHIAALELLFDVRDYTVTFTKNLAIF